jgi:hypothetical protein
MAATIYAVGFTVPFIERGGIETVRTFEYMVADATYTIH